MFMTFIAISILTAVFITMYLYLIRTHTMASEAERIYAEAAQEELKVILDRRARDILVNNTGGVGVMIKYLVGLDRSGATASIWEPSEPIPVPAGGSVVLADGVNASFPAGELYVMTERGNLFKAVPGGYHFGIEVYPANITLGNGSSAVVTLRLKAALLETPESGLILIVGDPSACTMTNATTRTRISNITYTTTEIVGGKTTGIATVVTGFGRIITLRIPRITTIRIPLNPLYGTITYVAEPTTMTVVRNVSVAYATETLNRTDCWVSAPRPITLTFTTKTRATITTPITIRARALDYWDESAECFIWFRVLNATSGSRLAEAGLRVEAAP